VAERFEELAQRGVVIAVSFADGWRIDAFRAERDWPMPIVSDPERRLYHAFGIDRLPWWRVWTPGVLARSAVLIARGYRPRRPTEDIYQGGGNVVLDGRGQLVWRRVGRGPDDRPSVETLLDAMKRAQTRSST